MQLINKKIEARLSTLNGLICNERIPLKLEIHPEKLPTPGDAEAAEYKPISVGDFWGWPDPDAWFHIRVQIPEELDGKAVQVILKLGGSSLVFLGGHPFQGIDPEHPELLLTPSAKAGEIFDLYIESFIGTFIYEPTEVTEMRRRQCIQAAFLTTINEEVYQYFVDLKMLLHSARALGIESEIGVELLNLADQSLERLDLRNPGDSYFQESIQTAHDYLRKGLEKLRNRYGNAGDVCLIGHAHIDTAWLWPLSETERKCGRTFSTALKLMEYYPEFQFVQSQPQLYEFTRKRYPELYQQIKKAAEKDQWEPAGAMWVEADTNISSSESLVRQCLYGKRFWKKEFGIDTRVLWLPDAFGYSYTLPQILRKSGVDYFMTTKISWNQFNQFPHTTFQWEGVDGSQVTCHFPPDTYNGEVNPEDIKRVWDANKSKTVFPSILFPVGFGDGGGGVTPWMLDHAKALKNIPGMPSIRMEKVSDFFKEIDTSKPLPVWNDELYLELHRGTLTTQSPMKKDMRKGELLMRETEIFASLSKFFDNPYPQEILEKQWKILLCNQFHDILPGSSVHIVYKEAAEQFRNLRKIIGQQKDQAVQNLCQEIDTQGNGKPIVVFNSLSWAATGIVQVSIENSNKNINVYDSKWTRVPCQWLDKQTLVFEAQQVPSLGYEVYHLEEGIPETEEIPLTAKTNLLENKFFRMELNGNRIVKLWDKIRSRDVLEPGNIGNRLVVHEDRPNYWDAWDIDYFYRSKFWEVDQVESAEVEENGSVFATVKVNLKYDKSRICQRIRIYHGIPRIDFITEVDWHESSQLLKVGFPMNIHTNHATYDIGYGSIQRPNHQNTSWDMARFEVSGHKWTDLSEEDYGVSLLNDCKYGHDALGNVLRISLLRSPNSPDAEADRGKQEFTYSIYPHARDPWSGGSVQAGYELNVLLEGVLTDSHPGTLPSRHSFIEVSAPNIIIEVIKKAEDSEEFILRAYECYNRRGEVTFTFDRPVLSAVETDLLEQETGSVSVEDSQIKVSYKPFEIKTIRFKLKDYPNSIIRND